MNKQAKQINLFTKRAKTAKIAVTPENEIQAAFFVWLRLHENRFPELRFCFAVPSGGHRFIATAVMMKRTGTKPGVPDVLLPVAKQGFHGLFVEFKTAIGKQSDVQKIFAAFLESQNYKVVICRTWTDAANIVIEYLNLPIPPLSF